MLGVADEFKLKALDDFRLYWYSKVKKGTDPFYNWWLGGLCIMGPHVVCGMEWVGRDLTG